VTDILRRSDETLVNNIREIDPDIADTEVAKALAGKTYS
jgi:hypothetical protein